MEQKKSLVLRLLILLALKPLVSGNAGLFTYYETPMFYRIGNKGVVMAHERAVGVGPSQWRNIFFPPIIAPLGNQCDGGVGQSTGYGQSPIRIPSAVRDKCDTDLAGYEFEGGDCMWNQLSFRVITNGVIVGPHLGETCSFGRMKIPGFANSFNILQFHIHTNSEHTVDGRYYPAELHMVHQESNQESFAVFGMFIDEAPDGEAHETFEYFLRGWERTTRQTDEYCAVNPDGTGEWTANSAFTSRQMRLQCPTVGSGIDPKDVEFDSSTGLPVEKDAGFPSGGNTTMPNVYESLPTAGYGVYTYRGGLTTPPCTEIVNWNLLDTPLYVSRSQLDRLYEVILCFVEISTCRHATIANEAGYTNRPVQPLNGRKVMHRCENGEHDFFRGVVPDEIPPTFVSVETQHRRCIMGGDGGLLNMCWIGEYESHFGLLFPWFVLGLGLAVFYLRTRYCRWLPYTAIMFFCGMLMGIKSVALDKTDQLTASIRMWEEIDAETLLLGFLPGLLFRDAYCSNVFLFKGAFWQCVIMAFPMVLAGTTLMALFGHFALPYGWSWSISMVFGAILSATDPVAVSALLNEVGAPPRLKIHISGESLLNDGSAIVFFTIFSQIFFYEFGIPGFGTDIDFEAGVRLFFRMSLGAIGVGWAFALGLLAVIFLLDRRFNYEESVVQVTATITAAYLCYYTAEAVLGMSGVISVVALGTATKFCGEGLISDTVMMEKFWTLIEHILNSLIFTLGGVVWGRIISNKDAEHIISFTFDVSDWGYMVLTFLFMVFVRFILVFSFYPVISRIGLGSNLKEATFISWGGLRGAVGIALAVALDKEIQEETLRPDQRRRFTTQLFGIVGGVAFLTLLVNGALCGPLLDYLGLANTGKAREAIVDQHQASIMTYMFDEFLKLMGEPQFAFVDFAHVRKHVSYFQDLKIAQIRFSVKRNKETTSVLDYKEPNLSTFRPFMSPDEYDELLNLARQDMKTRLKAVLSLAKSVDIGNKRQELIDFAKMRSTVRVSGEDEAVLVELRKVFIEILSTVYEEQFENGEVDSRHVRLVVILKTSIEVMRDRAASGEPLDDWAVIQDLAKTGSLENFKDVLVRKGLAIVLRKKSEEASHRRESTVYDSDCEEGVPESEMSGATIKTLVPRAITFIEAHKRAQEAFKEEFCSGQVLSDIHIKILDESNAQVAAAEASIREFSSKAVERLFGHQLCTKLLAHGAEYVGALTKKGMLSDQEAEHFLEHIEHDMDNVKECQITFDKMSRLKGHLCFIDHEENDGVLNKDENSHPRDSRIVSGRSVGNNSIRSKGTRSRSSRLSVIEGSGLAVPNEIDGSGTEEASSKDSGEPSAASKIVGTQGDAANPGNPNIASNEAVVGGISNSASSPGNDVTDYSDNISQNLSSHSSSHGDSVDSSSN